MQKINIIDTKYFRLQASDKSIDPNVLLTLECSSKTDLKKNMDLIQDLVATLIEVVHEELADEESEENK